MYTKKDGTNNCADIIMLCDEFVLYKRDDKELLLFPNLPRWVVLFSGGADGEVYPCPSFQDKRFSAGNVRESR